METKTAKWITIAGCGPGDPSFLTGATIEAVKTAEVLAGTEHLLAMFPDNGVEKIKFGIDTVEFLSRIENLRGRKVVVLVTGDPGIGSLADSVIERFGTAACIVIPGISSVQLAFARIGVSWQNVFVLDAHAGLPMFEPGSLMKHPKIAILVGSRDSRQWVEQAVRELTGTLDVIICRDLSLPSEKILRVTGAKPVSINDLEGRCIVVMLRKGILN